MSAVSWTCQLICRVITKEQASPVPTANPLRGGLRPAPAAGYTSLRSRFHLALAYGSYLRVTRGSGGKEAEPPASPRRGIRKWIYGIRAPGGPWSHMRGQACPRQAWSPNDGNPIRIQGIRTLWLRQRVLLKTEGFNAFGIRARMARDI